MLITFYFAWLDYYAYLCQKQTERHMNGRKEVFFLGLIILLIGLFFTFSLCFYGVMSPAGNTWETYAAIIASLLLSLYGFDVMINS